MTRNLVLLAALVAAAMLLVANTHDARSLFGDLQRAKALERQLDVQYRRLEASRRLLSQNLAVQSLAQSRLRMTAAQPEVTEYVRAPARTPATAAPAGDAR